MLAIELVGTRREGAGHRRCDAGLDGGARRGLLLLKAGVHGNCISVLVPLVISDGELAEALDAWEEALSTPRCPSRLTAGRRGYRSLGAWSGKSFADRYELEELVGSGGMSSVYRAHDRLSTEGRAEGPARPPPAGPRVRRALPPRGAAAPRLSHPNIVTVIDRGEHGGRQFIVFEYVGGQTLKGLIATEGPLPVDTALELTIQVARGLRSRTRTASCIATSSRRTSC